MRDSDGLEGRPEALLEFGPVVDIVAEALPRSERVTIDGADHVPHISVPGRYVELVRTFAQPERSAAPG